MKLFTTLFLFTAVGLFSYLANVSDRTAAPATKAKIETQATDDGILYAYETTTTRDPRMTA